MSDQMGGREKPDAGDRKGFGDDQGTRVGAPTPGLPDEPGHLAGEKGSDAEGGAARRTETSDTPTRQTPSTGAGSEASEGIHGADSDREPGDRTALHRKPTGRGEGEEGVDRSGSEPQQSHDRTHRSEYGGGSRKDER